jgi:hypothetical protein
MSLSRVNYNKLVFKITRGLETKKNSGEIVER